VDALLGPDRVPFAAASLLRFVARPPPVPRAAARSVARAVVLTAAVGTISGCAAPGPDYFPPAPLAVERAPDGRIEQLHDTNRDGRADYAERLGESDRIELLRFDLDQDGRFELEVPRASTRALSDSTSFPPRTDAKRHLIIIVDSVPFHLVRELWDQGRFRLFYSPCRVIAPFPVMTDPSLTEFFGLGPCPAVESEYFDGRQLNAGLANYLNQWNTPWLAQVDYRLAPIAHGSAYLSPDAWNEHELGRIQRRFEQSTARRYAGYCVSTSALGMQRGDDGHRAGLVRLDRLCQLLMYRGRGQLEITLLSDHGHNNIRSRRVVLRDRLAGLGYHVGRTIGSPRDVVVPEFGAVSCVAIHTHSPAAVAADVSAFEGVELCAFRDGDAVVVLSNAGAARIVRRGSRYAYIVERGDPLQLAGVLAELDARGAVDADGFIDDRALYEATREHSYPDPAYRLWRAFHGLLAHTPDVLVSLQEGYYAGSPGFTAWIDVGSVHGNLRSPSSCGFAMTTAGPLPDVLRMEDLAEALERFGVPVRRDAGPLARHPVQSADRQGPGISPGLQQ
jgi:predicted small lipoprotein YifL